jgi:hypothetical protein
MDVNEKIVEEWARGCKKQFTMANLRFKTRGAKGGSNYGDIDLLGLDVRGEVYDYEIKWRSVSWVGATPGETIEALAGQLLRSEREEKIRKIVGNHPCHRVFVTPRLMIGGKKKQELLDEFKKNNIEILYFEDVLSGLVDLIKDAGEKGRYDSETLQIIRMLRLLKIDITGDKNKNVR